MTSDTYIYLYFQPSSIKKLGKPVVLSCKQTNKNFDYIGFYEVPLALLLSEEIKTPERARANELYPFSVSSTSGSFLECVYRNGRKEPREGKCWGSWGKSGITGSGGHGNRIGGSTSKSHTKLEINWFCHSLNFIYTLHPILVDFQWIYIILFQLKKIFLDILNWRKM